MSRFIELLMWFISFSFLFHNCEKIPYLEPNKVVEIDFSGQIPHVQNKQSGYKEKPLNLAISAMISPKETYGYYEDLIQYISNQIGKPIELKQRKTYQEVNQLLASGQIEIAFICSGAYVDAEGKIPIEILTVPVVSGKPYYHAYVIVHKNSNIRSFKELEGKTFAFTDPISNTGRLYALKRIKDLKRTEEKFFKKTIYTYAHDYSIQTVSRKIIDGASVDGLIFDYLKKFYPQRVESIRIIEISEPFGIPPVVVSKKLNSNTKERLRSILLNMHKKIKGRKLLDKLMIDCFVSGDSTSYTSIRNNLIFIGQ
jgi:phosphonate transport system substrate-binding protein